MEDDGKRSQNTRTTKKTNIDLDLENVPSLIRLQPARTQSRNQVKNYEDDEENDYEDQTPKNVQLPRNNRMQTQSRNPLMEPTASQKIDFGRKSQKQLKKKEKNNST